MQPYLSPQSKDFVFEEGKTTNPDRKTAERRDVFTPAGRQRGQEEIKSQRMAAVFAEECHPISPPPVCWGVNTSMWPCRVNKEMK